MLGSKSITALILVMATSAVAAPAKQKEKLIDPVAIDALDTMGAFLREQESFDVHVVAETDYVLGNGQKVRRSAYGTVRVRKPDHLRAEIRSDRRDRQFFYDGETFTIYSPRMGFYATSPATGTIRELADQLQTKYGLELPLVDLFRWGTDEDSAKEITQATYVGPAVVDGVQTDQYAFRQPGLDWQIWIDQGERPVPRKLVLTTTDVPARPERAVELTWNLATHPDDKVFAFTPPKDAQRIPLAEIAPAKRTHPAHPARQHLDSTQQRAKSARK
ncbi:MAG: DUF2092 domain-containing protein [Deltaproteobacteria bacterium]|nr:DUF2092 domain-containing protein [Deltaproteobacteria bacterium]